MKHLFHTVFTLLCLLPALGGACYCSAEESDERPARLSPSAPIMDADTISALYDEYLGDEPGIDHSARKEAFINTIRMMDLASTPEELKAACKRLDRMPDFRQLKISPEDARVKTKPVPEAELSSDQAKYSMYWFDSSEVEVRLETRHIIFFNKVLLPVYDRFFRKLDAVVQAVEYDCTIGDNWKIDSSHLSAEQTETATLQAGMFRDDRNRPYHPYIAYIFTMADPTALDKAKPGDTITVQRYVYAIPEAFRESLKGGLSFPMSRHLHPYMKGPGDSGFSTLNTICVSNESGAAAHVMYFFVSPLALNNEGIRVKASARFFNNNWKGVDEESRFMAMPLENPDPDGSLEAAASGKGTDWTMECISLLFTLLMACLFGGPWLAFPLMVYRFIRDYYRKIVPTAGGLEGLTSSELVDLVVEDPRACEILGQMPELRTRESESGGAEVVVETIDQVDQIHNIAVQLDQLPDKSPALVSFVNYLSDELRWMERRVFTGNVKVWIIASVLYANAAYFGQNSPLFMTLALLGPILAYFSMLTPVTHFNKPLPGYMNNIGKAMAAVGMTPLLLGLTELGTRHITVYKNTTTGEKFAVDNNDQLERGAIALIVGFILALVFMTILGSIYFTLCAFYNYRRRS